MGTVWPFVTGFAAWAQYRYRRPWAGFHLMDAVRQMTFDWSLGRHGELFSGTFYQPLDQTVPHQFFATSMLATPLLRGVFGWEPDAPRGRARLAPQLPPTGRRRRRGVAGGRDHRRCRGAAGVGGGGRSAAGDDSQRGAAARGGVRAGCAGGGGGGGGRREWSGPVGRSGEGGPGGRPWGPSPIPIRVTEGQAAEIVVTWEGGLAVASLGSTWNPSAQHGTAHHRPGGRRGRMAPHDRGDRRA